jgi:hypothetical protein
MFRNRSHSCFTVLSILSVVALASADTGYLPRVGPAPLRFQSVPKTATNHYELPPPEPTPEPQPVATKPDVKTPTLAVKTPATTETTVISSQIPAPAVEPDSGPGRSEDVVSPQMLLRYFSKSTNGTATSIVAPIQFTPPKTETPPSKATFTTSP